MKKNSKIDNYLYLINTDNLVKSEKNQVFSFKVTKVTERKLIKLYYLIRGEGIAK